LIFLGLSLLYFIIYIFFLSPRGMDEPSFFLGVVTITNQKDFLISLEKMGRRYFLFSTMMKTESLSVGGLGKSVEGENFSKIRKTSLP